MYDTSNNKFDLSVSASEVRATILLICTVTNQHVVHHASASCTVVTDHTTVREALACGASCYTPIAFDERVTFWLQRTGSLPCACVFAALYACTIALWLYASLRANNAT